MSFSSECFNADSPCSFSSETDSQLAHFFQIIGCKKKRENSADKFFYGQKCKNWEEADRLSQSKIDEMQRLGYNLKKLEIWYKDIYGTIYVVRDVEYDF